MRAAERGWATRSVEEIHFMLSRRFPEYSEERCPRSYRYSYLDGWLEKETHAGMILGRCFEKPLAACFLDKTAARPCSQEWSSYRDSGWNPTLVRTGIASTIRASAYSSFSPATTALEFAIHNKPCKSSSFNDRCGLITATDIARPVFHILAVNIRQLTVPGLANA
jgi:hypothetical protein